MAQVEVPGMFARLRAGMVRRGWGRLYVPAVIAAAALMAVLVVCALVRFWPQAASDEDFHTTASQQQTSAAASPDRSETGQLVVDVSGCVAAPGVYTIDEGGRVVDAVTAAGGALDEADTSSVNLARRLVDGEQIHIPSATEAAALSSSSGGTDASGALVNINTADAEALCTLDGIGETTAGKIVDDRTKNGPFVNKEDIMRVSGIGEGRYAAIEDRICV